MKKLFITEHKNKNNLILKTRWQGLNAETIMSNLTLNAGSTVTIDGVTYVVSANPQGGVNFTKSTRKPLNYDAATGNLTDEAGNTVGRVNFRSGMGSAAIPELGEQNVTVVVSDAYAKGYDLKVVKVANTNKNKKPDWAGGAFIGTRQEWALYLDKK